MERVAARRVAVLRANALGDLIFSLPALSALRSRFPDAELTWIGRSLHADFFDGRPGPPDRVEVLPAIPGVSVPVGTPPASDLGRWLDQQRSRHYDLAVQLHGGGRYSNPLVAALGAKLTVGLRASDAPALDRVVPYVYYQSEIVRCLEVVSLVEARGDPYPRLAVTQADRRAAGSALSALGGDRYVVIHPGATDPRRRWPPRRFAATADALADRGLAVVLTGTVGERELISAIRAASHADLLDVAGRLDFNALVGVLAAADLVISNDTGPLHVADAVGTKTIGIFWCGNLVNGGPLRRSSHRPLLSWTIHCPECGANCTRDIFPARTGGQACQHRPSFVADVPTVEVIEAADALLEPANV